MHRGAVPEHHSLFVYDGDGGFVDRATSFLGAGTEDGETGVAVLSEGKWELLRESLGEGSRRVTYVDRETVYTLRPEATIAHHDAMLRRLVAEGAPMVRLLAEFPVWETDEQRDAWVLYGAVLNRAFAHHPVSIVCGYDLREHPAAVVEGARRTHPTILADAWEDNPLYQDPAQVVAGLTPDPEPLPDLRELPVDPDPRALLDRLGRELDAVQVPDGRADSLLAAAAMVLDNVQSHGGGARSQRLGRVGERFVWELSDNGPGFEDPMAGSLPPRSETNGGTGLWAIRQLTERLEFLSSPPGFTTRIWV